MSYNPFAKTQEALIKMLDFGEEDSSGLTREQMACEMWQDLASGIYLLNCRHFPEIVSGMSDIYPFDRSIDRMLQMGGIQDEHMSLALWTVWPEIDGVVALTDEQMGWID